MEEIQKAYEWIGKFGELVDLFNEICQDDDREKKEKFYEQVGDVQFALLDEVKNHFHDLIMS